MGALEQESGSKHGHVLIPNYLQASSNCMVSTSAYRVCCMDECAGLARKVELAIHNSSAQPQQLLHHVREQATGIWGVPPTRAAAAALKTLAASQGGQIALHGRAYAHWLHTAFPWACPLPGDAPTTPARAVPTPAVSVERQSAAESDVSLAAVRSSEKSVLAGSRSTEGRAQDVNSTEPETQLASQEHTYSSDTHWKLNGGELAEISAPWLMFMWPVAIVGAASLSMAMAGALRVTKLRSQDQRSRDVQVHLC